MAKNVCMMFFSHLHSIGLRSFSPGTVHQCQLFLSRRTNYNSVNWALVNAPCDVARKWLLLLGNSWADRMLPYCWLRTMISQSSCRTTIPCYSTQCVCNVQQFWSYPVSYTCLKFPDILCHTLISHHWQTHVALLDIVVDCMLRNMNMTVRLVLVPKFWTGAISD